MSGVEEEDGVKLGFPVELPLEAREQGTTRRLQPWHKPRKHWVRLEHWRPQIHKLLQELDLSERAFRYLTLPGEDLLDIRHIYTLFEAQKKKLRFLGVDSSRNSAAMTVSEQEVRDLEFVDRHSVILGDRFEDICNEDTVAYQRTLSFTSFDAVNLDLCDAVARPKTHPDKSILPAIIRLLQRQRDKRSEPWVLFLTTRADRDSVHKQVATQLVELLDKNISRYVSFRQLLSKTGVFSAESVVQELGSGPALSSKEFTLAFGVGFCKWLLSCADQDWMVKAVSAAGYRVKTMAESPDMLSIVLRFEKWPRLVTDPNNVVTIKPHGDHSGPSVEELELDFLNRFAALTDVDRLVFENEELRRRLVEENADLLTRARFDRAIALDFGNNSYWRPK